MDTALRALREGAPEPGAAAPLLLLEDSLAVLGGPAVLLQAVAELAGCIAQGRAQAQSLTVLTLDRPPSEYQAFCRALPPSQLCILDCCTDPYGWAQQLQQERDAGGQTTSGAQPPPAAAAASGGTRLLSGVLEQRDGLQQLAQAASESSLQRQCLVVDNLSRLLDCFGVGPVCQWLHALQRAPTTSCLLCALHADLHPLQAQSTLEYLASGWVQLQPLSKLERPLCGVPAELGGAAAGEAHGRVSVRLKRRAGRVRTEARLYRVFTLDGDGAAPRVAYWDVPPAAASLAETAVAAAMAEATPAPAAAAAAAAPGWRAKADGAAGSAAVSGLAVQIEGGMALGLTQEEEEARRRVQLPYEHQGQGDAYQTGDFRDYLPPEAGGRAGGGGRLGQILYVRDSGSEHDSDEDPDDDLYV